jgi:hypothetical protein
MTCATVVGYRRTSMFSRILAQSTTLLRRVQNVRYPITSPTQALTGVRHNHTPDSYSKDIDHTPPSDEKIHRIDPDSDRVQKPYEAPSGEWSRAGVQTHEYRTVEEKQPYAPKGSESTRYGARKTLTEDKGAEMSKSDEGPEGKSSRGRRE